MILIPDVFPILQTLKNKLDKCLNSFVSEDCSKSKIVNSPKRCWNLNDSTFTIFIDQCERNLRSKSLCYWYTKFLDSLLKNWLPITSYLFLIETILATNSGAVLSKPKIFFSIFLSIFLI